MEHLAEIKNGARGTPTRVAVVNDDSVEFAHKRAGEFIKTQHTSNLVEWSKAQQLGFVRHIICAYLNNEIDMPFSDELPF